MNFQNILLWHLNWDRLYVDVVLVSLLNFHKSGHGVQVFFFTMLSFFKQGRLMDLQIQLSQMLRLIFAIKWNSGMLTAVTRWCMPNQSLHMTYHIIVSDHVVRHHLLHLCSWNLKFRTGVSKNFKVINAIFPIRNWNSYFLAISAKK